MRMAGRKFVDVALSGESRTSESGGQRSVIGGGLDSSRASQSQSQSGVEGRGVDRRFLGLLSYRRGGFSRRTSASFLRPGLDLDVV